jgi:LPXTG-motif cell wall anchor domain protein
MARVGAVHRNVVKTGDSSNAFTYALVLVLAGAALAGVVSYRRKRA